MELSTSNNNKGRNKNRGLLPDVKFRKGQVEIEMGMEILCRLFLFESRRVECCSSASEGKGEAMMMMNGPVVPMSVNRRGHERKSGSEILHSTVSTVVGGSGQQQQQRTQQEQSQAELSRPPPRRRKGVLVSLKPTFSPSLLPGRRSIAREHHLYRSRVWPIVCEWPGSYYRWYALF